MIDGGILEYEVFRDGVSIGTRAGTQYADTGLAESTSYEYTVTAKANNGTSSDLSVPLAITTLATTVPIPDPDVPTNLVAGTITSTTIEFTWDEVIYSEGTITYDIYRDGTIVSVSNVALASYEDTGLTPGVTYAYKVVAVGSNGQSSVESEELSIETTA